MEQTLQIILNAKDATASAFNSARGGLDAFKGKVESMEPTFKKMALAGTVAFGAITAVVVSSLKESAAAQADMAVANTTLENALKSLSGDALANLQKQAGSTAGGLKFLQGAMGEASKAALNLGFDDEAASKSFAKLFQVTKDTAQANKELQVAMDMARAKGISLEDATQKLVMVHSGATKALKAEGLAIDENADALTNINSLAQTYANQASTYASTAAGQFDIFKEKLNNVKQAVGDSLSPAFQKALSALQPMIDKFTAWAEKNPDLLAKIILIAGGIAGLVAVMGTLGLILPPIIAFFGLLSAPVLAVAAAIAGIVWIVIECIRIFNMLKNDGDLIWLGIKTSIQEKIQAVQDVITKVINAIKTVWTTVWTSIRDFFKNIWDTITTTAKAAINSIKDFLAPIINMVDNVISKLASIGKSVGGTIKGAINKVGNVLGINDGIVQNGQIITTHPDDYIVATKDPSSLGGRGGITVNINGGQYLSEAAALEIGDHIVKALQMQMRAA